MRPRMLVLLTAVALTVSGCAATPSLFALPGIASYVLRDRPSEPIEVADPGTGDGSIVSAETMPNLPWSVTNSGVNAARVVYRSMGREVSGSVFTPSGVAPENGWPVISFGHGTTGIDVACGPSLSQNLLGTAALAAGYTEAGYAVAITDYQGLGHEGVHRYLDNVAAGYDIIDAVRALRHVFPNASNRWIAFGASQGGGAAWAANEKAAHAMELELVGSASLAPAANMVGLVDKATEGTLTADQAPLLQWVLESQSRADRSLDLDLYRTSRLAEDWDALSSCATSGASARTEAAARIGPMDFAPQTSLAADELRTRLESMAVPQQRASAPMFVAYGDADTYIDAEWTDAALAEACALGSVVTIDRQAGRGHGDVDGNAVNQWISERFAGEPAVDDCNRG